MILIAVLAPVIIVAVLIAGAATLAVLVTGVAALGGLVAGCSETAMHALSRQRARRLATGATSMEWPRPTSQPESAYCMDRYAEPGAVDEDEEVPLTVEVEDPVLVSMAACAAADAAHSSRVSSWEEVYPAFMPDFEELDAYTLVAGTADIQ